MPLERQRVTSGEKFKREIEKLPQVETCAFGRTALRGQIDRENIGFTTESALTHFRLYSTRPCSIA